MIPENYRDLLNTTALVHVATIGPKGEPQSTPVWFGWDGAHVSISQTKGRQKYHNLLRNPLVALSLVDPANSYRYLEIRGTVVRMDDDQGNAFINSMAKKYLGQDTYSGHQPGDERVVVVIEPQHTTQMG